MKPRRMYLAYGSNLDVEQMRFRCPDARIVGWGLLHDYQLLFKGSKTGAYLTIEHQRGAVVPVGVWSVTAVDEQALDRYEGYPRFYRKFETDVDVRSFVTGASSCCRAFVYAMPVNRAFGMPRASYLNTCQRGYEYFNFSPVYLEDALTLSGGCCDVPA